MQGDFTRDTFDPTRHFSRVLIQQGRVQLDADWNEQTAILLHTLRTLTRGLVAAMHTALAAGVIPPHTDKRARCRGCSLSDICLPEETEELVRET